MAAISGTTDDDELIAVKFDQPVGDEPFLFLSWRVRLQQIARPGLVLFEYADNNGRQRKFRWPPTAKQRGCIEWLAELNGPLQAGTLVAKLKCSGCEHSVVMKDICADCGKDLRRVDGLPGEREPDRGSTAKIPLIHNIPELHVAEPVAMRHGKNDLENLLSQRKLALLVDLDQTLLHTTNDAPAENSKQSDIHSYRLYGPQSPWYHTRLRPFTRDVLGRLSAKYELHICTFGQRLYAHEMARLLDPDQKLFHYRILSRDECFNNFTKAANLGALFPCGDHMTCIVDDREDVWRQRPGETVSNLIRVKPYRFFRHTGDIHAPPAFAKNDLGEDAVRLGEQDKEEEEIAAEEAVCKAGVEKEETDDYLLHLESILEKVHREFYSRYDTGEANLDLNVIMPAMKRAVLSNVKLVFSGVIPLEVASNPEATSMLPIYKVTIADKAGVPIVRPSWLWCCVERWENVDGRLFVLTKPCSVTEKSSGSVEKSSADERHEQVAEEPSPQPVLAMSADQVRRMTDEVEDALSDETDSEGSAADGVAQARLEHGMGAEGKEEGDSSSEAESLEGRTPKGWRKKRRRLEPSADSDSDESSSHSRPADGNDDEFDESVGSVDQEMLDALDKELAQ